MVPDASIDRLRDRLVSAEYTYEAVAARLGDAGAAALGRNTTLAAEDALAGAVDPQSTLMRLWLVQEAVPRAEAARALGDVDALVRWGLLRAEGDRVRALVEVRPYAAGATAAAPALSAWVCHDPLNHLDGRFSATPGDFVLGVSPASTTLAQLTIRTPVRSALDLGTGCGIQALHLAGHARRVVATDLNPRALRLARLTTGLGGVAADLREGSLYEPVAEETFDLIVSNPPFVMSPPSGKRLTYREGTLPGDELVRQVVTGGASRLAPEGTMQVLCNWAIVAGRPWADRLAGWIAPTGCDAFVLERERLDPYEYAEIWLADAGVPPEAYRPRYRDWLDYFATLGITAVGLGWISLRRAGREQPDLRFEAWPHAVHQPLGAALAAQQAGVDLAARSDAALLAARWRVHQGVVQETVGRPGAPDPEHLVLRQGYGLGRAIVVDTALAALVGACDGDLTAAQIIGALADLTQADGRTLTAALTPRLRDLVRDGFLVA